MSFTPTASLPGAINNAGDNKAIFLKVFTGMVLTEFKETTQFSDKHTVKEISSGKSGQFPVMGGLGPASKYLAQGDSVTQGVMNHSEQVIVIDGYLYESLFLSKQDDVFSQIDVRMEYARQIAKSLAQNWDRNVAAVGIQAARSANVVTGQPGGSVVVNAAAKTDGDALFQALFEARKVLDEKNIDEQAWAFLQPEQYYLLAQVDKIIDKDLNDGNGGMDTGIVKGIAGMIVVKSNNLPVTNITGTIGGKYDVDASNTAALVMTKHAVGTLKLMDITTEMEWLIEYQSWLMVSAIMMGHGILQPQAAVEIATA